MSKNGIISFRIVFALIFLAMAVFMMVPAYSDPTAGEVVMDMGIDLSEEFEITNDPNTGYLTVENNNVKAVWHYNRLPSEFNNRGGGNIYELYDKSNDPAAVRNLVGLYNGADQSSATGPPKPGIGGLGSTYLYSDVGQPATGDNGRYARLAGQEFYRDGNGNFVYNVSFIVSRYIYPHVDNYRVDKSWTLFKDGQIRLNVTMTILRNLYAAEPAYNFSFSRDYGWQTASTLNHYWSLAECYGVGGSGTENHHNDYLTINGIAGIIDRNTPLLHNQQFSLHGQNSGSSVIVKMDNDGKGFENGGLFALGALKWNTTKNPTSEYSNFSQLGYAHVLHYYAWWGGGNPAMDRYKYLAAGTTWSDTIWIEMVESSNLATPEIVDVPVAEHISETGATIKWTTDKATDSRVFYKERNSADLQSRSQTTWTPEHEVLIDGLLPGRTYDFEVRSKDATGEVVDYGSLTTTGIDGVSLVPELVAVQWLSYQDYLARLLAVDFSVINVGLKNAYNAEALSTVSTSGVTGEPQNGFLGAIDSGERVPLNVVYRVPMGVDSFNTIIYFRAEDITGQVYYSPEPEPSD